MRKETVMQMVRRLGIVAVCLGAVVMTSCGKKVDQDESARTAEAVGTQAPVADTAVPDYAKMTEENRKALTEMNQGKDIEAVPAATLKALLPAELPGLKRTDASAERTQMMGVNMSNAEGQYSAADGSEANVRIKLTDTGNMSGSMRLGMSAWAMGQYSRETDTGYEKTTTINGCKAMEKYDTQNKEGSLQIMVADRFIVDVEGYGVTMETLKQVVGQIDLKKLAASGS
jgi:hypothetical protein